MVLVRESIDDTKSLVFWKLKTVHFVILITLLRMVLAPVNSDIGVNLAIKFLLLLQVQCYLTQRNLKLHGEIMFYI